MPYLAPGSQIILYPNIPFTKDYENTMYFGSFTVQTNWFEQRTVKYPFLNQSYQRWDSGKLQLDVASNTNADAMYTCNYLRFQNTPFGSKWYCAFIDRINYVNNETIEVEYTIDVVQTWLWNLSFEQCFIEREHTASDGLFEHTVPENLDLGPTYVVQENGISQFAMNDMSLGVLATCDLEGNPSGGIVKNNLYSGLNVIAGIPLSDPSTVTTLIQNLIDSGDEDSIVSMYEYPSFLGDAATWNGQSTHTHQRSNYVGGSYTPRNKKLHCYPYTFLHVHNNSGQSADFHWEDFTYLDQLDSQVQFKIQGVHVPSPVVLCYPLMHRGVGEDIESGLEMSNFPTLAWAGDAFKAWYAQNANSQKMGILNTILNNTLTYGSVGATISGFNPYVTAAGAVGGALIGTAVGVSNAMAKNEDLKNTPAQAHGQVSTSSFNTVWGRNAFYFCQMTIKEEYARKIDAYFDMYGYKVNRVGQPSLNNRQRWTYVKTIGCDFQGGCPSADKEELCKIFDKGIRFWKDSGDMGNYSLGNLPLSDVQSE